MLLDLVSVGLVRVVCMDATIASVSLGFLRFLRFIGFIHFYSGSPVRFYLLLSIQFRRFVDCIRFVYLLGFSTALFSFDDTVLITLGGSSTGAI